MRPFNFQVQEDGKLTQFSRQLCANAIADFAGKWIQLTIGERAEKRSLDQNAYYWTAIAPHVRKVRFDMGDPVTIEQTHEDLLEEFAPRVTGTRLDGSTYSRPMRSRHMSVGHMADFITAITARMAEMGEPVPVREGDL